MNVAHLVKMANSIADFFASMPSDEEALTGFRQHLEKFWSPAMRAALTTALQQQADETNVTNESNELHPLARQALLKNGSD